MSFHNLSNEEIVFLFFVSKSIVDQYETVYNDQVIEQTIPTDFGVMKLGTAIPKELVEEMLKSKHYLFMKSINEKLLPIYEIIKDVEPDLVQEVEILFEKK
jgi:hypothetical protein